MKKHRLITVLLVLLLVTLSAACIYAADEKATKAADVLYELGLFAGTGTNEDGTPIYSLDRELNRQEAMTLFINLLGKGEEAMAGTWTTPFTDVDEWAQPFIGYAYEHDFTAGVAADRFGAHDPIDGNQYLTYLLLALGYEQGTDFVWNKSVIFAEEIGFNDVFGFSTIKRSDAVLWNCNALALPKKGSEECLPGTFDGKPADAAFIAADQGFLFTWDEGKKTVVAHYGTDLALTNRCESDKIESRYDAALIPQSKKLQLYDNGSGRSYDYYYGLDGLYRIQDGGLQQLSARPVLQMIFLRYGATSSSPVILTFNPKDPVYPESPELFAGDTIIEIKEDGTEDVFLHGNTNHGIKIGSIWPSDSIVHFNQVIRVWGENYSTYTYALLRQYDAETGKSKPSILTMQYEEGDPEGQTGKAEEKKRYEEQKRLFELGIGSDPGPEGE
jgi:hypothetical protein